jgi:hypothetical protein
LTTVPYFSGLEGHGWSLKLVVDVSFSGSLVEALPNYYVNFRAGALKTP